MPCGGTRPGEEVRDDPHSDNRSGSKRCGVAPTAAPLRSQDGSELSGTGLYTAHVVGRVVLPPLLGQRGLRFGPSPTGLRLYTVPGRALHGASWSVALRSAFLYVARDLGLRPYYPRRAGHTTDRTAYNFPPTCSAHRLLS